MKKITLTIVVVLSFAAKSQDTLFLKTSNKPVPCKINKIISNNISYKVKNSLKEISMVDVFKYSIGKVQFKNGTLVRDFDGKSITVKQCQFISIKKVRCTNITINKNGSCDAHQ